MAATVDTDGDTHQADQHQPADHEGIRLRHLGFCPPRGIFFLEATS